MGETAVNFDMGNLVGYGEAILAIANILVAGIMLRARNEFAPRRAVESMQARLTAVESHLASQPSAGKLALKVEELNGDIKALSAEIHGLRELLNRVERPLAIMLEHEIRK